MSDTMRERTGNRLCHQCEFKDARHPVYQQCYISGCSATVYCHVTPDEIVAYLERTTDRAVELAAELREPIDWSLT